MAKLFWSSGHHYQVFHEPTYLVLLPHHHHQYSFYRVPESCFSQYTFIYIYHWPPLKAWEGGDSAVSFTPIALKLTTLKGPSPIQQLFTKLTQRQQFNTPGRNCCVTMSSILQHYFKRGHLRNQEGSKLPRFQTVPPPF